MITNTASIKPLHADLMALVIVVSILLLSGCGSSSSDAEAVVANNTTALSDLVRDFTLIPISLILLASPAQAATYRRQDLPTRTISFRHPRARSPAGLVIGTHRPPVTQPILPHSSSMRAAINLLVASFSMAARVVSNSRPRRHF